MSESSSKKTVDKTTTKPKARKKPTHTALEDFRTWLGKLPSTPKLHVNGVDYSTAVLTVDFGTPLEESVKLTAEQNAELVSYMKLTTRGLFNKPELNVRVQSDTSNGVWWTTLN